MSQSLTGSYVWGLDGSPGTFISDYVIFGLCVVYGLCIFRLYKANEQNKDSPSNIKVPGVEKFHLDGTKAKPFLFVLTLTFFVCAFMNAIGAVMHQFVPYVQPVSQVVDGNIPTHENFDLWSMMLERLYPWVLMWQLANISAALYGILIYLSAVYAVEFYEYYQDSVLKIDFVNGQARQSSPKKRGVHYLKRVTVTSGFLTIFLICALRVWRVFEFRNNVFGKTVSSEDINLDIEKLDLDKFGWMWSSTSASAIIFTAFLANATVSTYMLIKSFINKIPKTMAFGGIKVPIVRAVGSWMLMIGGCIQIFWAGSCASNMPTECPFPVWFNHNAWYHLLQGVGMTLWFLAEWTNFKYNGPDKKNL